jgi:cyclopropane-fatty-acyl-phospholipid synthase
MQNTFLISRKRRTDLYQDIILRLLSRMNRGRLDIQLPDGSRIFIGDEPELIHARIRIRDTAFFKRCILYGDIGFGEAYVDGLWDTNDITTVISWALLNIDLTPGLSGSRTRTPLVNGMKWWNRLLHVKRANTVPGSHRNISEHYDLNNEFFRLFLDPTMTYSSAYFERDGMDLEEAQLAKYRRLCEQLHLSPEDHVLEIGTGWGANAIYMARHYGCRVTSLTISEEQYRLAIERVAAAGLQDRVTILLEDYRNFEGRFDKIVSVEMLEAVGHRYLDDYFRKCEQWLKQDGILVLQVITCPDSRYNSLRKGVDWIQKHIFPGSLLPSVGAINTAVNRTGEMHLVDLKDLGLHYAATLRVWFLQFNSRLTQIRALGFDERFIRKWNYYLCYCEAAFRMRNIHVMQLVYTRPNNLGR